MQLNVTWKEQFNDKEGVPFCIYDVAYSSNGKQIAVTVGSNIYIYSSKDGRFVTSLKNHRDTVISLSYSMDGRRFASGGLDKQVIIWTSEYEGILKYSHCESIRCLQFNSVTGQLVSCSSSDFGIWSPEQESVIKHKISSTINNCCWSSDGHFLALGVAAGYISLRSRTGEEKLKIEKSGGIISPISGLAFNPLPEDDTLAVIDWSQSLFFLNTLGKQLNKELPLGFDPLSISYFNNGKYLLICGSNREAHLYSKNGIFIGSIGKQNGWVWSCKASPEGNQIALVSQDGVLVVTELIFTLVQSLYKDLHAFRENMTDVIIHNFVTEEKVRIKCRDLIKKLAIYKNKLAIELSEQIVIYELFKKDGSEQMHYKVKEKINQSFECTSMIVCSDCLIISKQEKLQCFSFKGNLEKEWILDSLIRYVKIIGGPPSKEQLLVGLNNGQVVQIFVKNSFPIKIVKVSYPVCCLDISMLHKKLAILDEHNNLSVYEIKSKTLLYQETNANSIAWNTQFEDIICFSSSKNLSIKVSNFPAHHQYIQGFVIGFSGSKVLCLYNNSISAVEVSQSVPMYQYIEKKLFKEAYKIACFKATDYEFEQLALKALEQIELEVAMKAFAKIKNYVYLDFINSLKPLQTKSAKLLFMGDVLAFKNQFSEAAKFYKQAGFENKATNMYNDLKMFESAQDLIKSKGDLKFQKHFDVKKADWVNNISDPRAAAEMYLSAGEIKKVIEIVSQYGYIDVLTKVVNQLDKGDQNNLSLCGDFFVKHKQYFMAAEVYKKIGDVKNLVSIFIKSCQWDEALKLVEEHPDLKPNFYVKYATWLAENDQFVEAQKAFHKAGKVSEAIKVLNQLTSNAVNEHRYNDASYYSWILSMQCLDIARESTGLKVSEYISKFKELQIKADVYYAYHFIHRYVEEPFTSLFPDVLFNIARFLFYKTLNVDFVGISKVTILYVFAKHARNLGAYKLARLVYEKLHTLVIPPRFQEAIELGDVTIRAKPFSDAEDLLPLCYRCSTTNTLYNEKGNQCTNCRQPFIFSFINFDILPLVEFELEDGFSETEAIEIVNSVPNISHSCKRLIAESEWNEEHNQKFEALRLSSDHYKNRSDENESESFIFDPFIEKMSSFQNDELDFEPILVSPLILKNINPSDLIIADWPAPLKKSFYRNLISDISITKCSFCHKFFHTDEFELQILKVGHCPFCRNSNKAMLK